MVWRWSAPIAVVIVLAGAASPAFAKGPESARVTGPGLKAATVTYTQRAADVDLADLSEATLLYDVWLEGQNAVPSRLHPEDSLGPRYTVVYDFYDDSLTQYLYPLATRGPLIFTPPHQMVWSNRVSSGFRAAPDKLARVLTTLGARLQARAPQRSLADPARKTGPSISESPTDASRQPWGRLTIGIAGLLAVVSVCARFWIARTRPRPSAGAVADR